MDFFDLYLFKQKIHFFMRKQKKIHFPFNKIKKKNSKLINPTVYSSFKRIVFH